MNHLKFLVLFRKNLKFLFCNIYKDGKPNYKYESFERNVFKK